MGAILVRHSTLPSLVDIISHVYSMAFQTCSAQQCALGGNVLVLYKWEHIRHALGEKFVAPKWLR